MQGSGYHNLLASSYSECLVGITRSQASVMRTLYYSTWQRCLPSRAHILYACVRARMRTLSKISGKMWNFFLPWRFL